MRERLNWENYTTSQRSYSIAKLSTAKAILSINKDTHLILAYHSDDGVNQDLLGLALVQPSGEAVVNPHFSNADPNIALSLTISAGMYFDKATVGEVAPSPLNARQVALPFYPKLIAWVYPEHECVTAHYVDAPEKTLAALILPFELAMHPEANTDSLDIHAFLIEVAKAEIGLMLDGAPRVEPAPSSPSESPAVSSPE